MENYCSFRSAASCYRPVCQRQSATFPHFCRFLFLGRLAIWSGDFNIHYLSITGVARIFEFQFDVAWISFKFGDVESRLLKQLTFLQDFEHIAYVFHVHYWLVSSLLRLARPFLKVLDFLGFKHRGFLKHHLVGVLVFGRLVF